MEKEIKRVELWDERGDGGGFVKITDKKDAYPLLPEFPKEKKFCPVCKIETEFQSIPAWTGAKPQFICLECNVMIIVVKENCPTCEGISPHYHYSANAFSKHRRFCPKLRADKTIKLQNGIECGCGLQIKK
jgi:RNA polymerase subunit RPABC4/transcription elongation factor Spt4